MLTVVVIYIHTYIYICVHELNHATDTNATHTQTDSNQVKNEKSNSNKTQFILLFFRTIFQNIWSCDCKFKNVVSLPDRRKWQNGEMAKWQMELTSGTMTSFDRFRFKHLLERLRDSINVKFVAHMIDFAVHDRTGDHVDLSEIFNFHFSFFISPHAKRMHCFSGLLSVPGRRWCGEKPEQIRCNYLYTMSLSLCRRRRHRHLVDHSKWLCFHLMFSSGFAQQWIFEIGMFAYVTWDAAATQSSVRSLFVFNCRTSRWMNEWKGYFHQWAE